MDDMTAGIPDRIGPYDVLRELGRGGMGVVYLARDEKLDRDVAIKAMPEDLAADEDRLTRFEREAKVLASIRHPNIAGVYGLEEVDGHRYIVLEYIEGEDLSTIIDRGPLPTEEALDVARQIASAVEAAHAKSVIHRDLKPANIKLGPDGHVAVLDFGLAKSVEGGTTESVALQHSPTIVASPTVPGVILGTAGYMSPEQARGRKVDRRTDIWSFGCVVFEMLAGRQVFSGETVTDSIGAILHAEPDWTQLPADTPPTIQLMLRRCLSKDRHHRLHDIADARVEIEAAIADPSSSMLTLAGAALADIPATSAAAPRSSKLPWLVAVVAILVAVAAFVLPSVLRTETRRPPTLLNIDLTPDTDPLRIFIGAQFALSPDGRLVAFVTGESDRTMLRLRRMDQLESTVLSGTEGASHPFFSPDGEWIGFFTREALKKVSIFGGAPQTLAEVDGWGRGGHWGTDGTILFAPDTTTGIRRVRDVGGEAESITTPDEEARERSHRWPQYLPGEQAMLITAQDRSTNFNDARIEVVLLETGERRVIQRGASYGRYVPSGHLVYVREGTLFAAPFDLDTLELTASPAPILEQVVFDPRNGGAQYAFSQAGDLLYRTGRPRDEVSRIAWVGMDGEIGAPVRDEPVSYAAPTLSPDGRYLAYHTIPTSTGNADVWTYDMERDVETLMTFDEGMDIRPIWSPDGTQIVFTSTREGVTGRLHMKPADGSADAVPLPTGDGEQFAGGFSPDGRLLIYMMDSRDTGWDLWALDLEAGTNEPILQTEHNEFGGHLSPDGRWLVYASAESGRPELYVRPFPGPGGRWQISNDGGRFACWSPDGSTLYYFSGDETIMAVDVTVDGSAFRAGAPKELMRLEFGGPTFFAPFDLAPDGERFLALLPAEERDEPVDRSHLTLYQNWLGELAAQIPTR